MKRPLNPEKCYGSISHGFYSYQCSRKGSIEEDGKVWCKQHAPSLVQKKREAERARWEKEWAEERENRRIAAVESIYARLFKELVEKIAAGCNNPRADAQELLQHYREELGK